MTGRQTRLIFAIDATASREPTWAMARQLHATMFSAAIDGTNLAVQLCWYRGLTEFYASRWLTTPADLLSLINTVSCEGGATQLARLLEHALGATSNTARIKGLVFIGDAVEEPESQLLDLAAQCRLKRCPLFIFQEGHDTRAAHTFEQMSKLSGGAYARFDQQGAERLRELLGAVARYTSGGRRALLSSAAESDKILLAQLPPEATSGD